MLGLVAVCVALVLALLVLHRELLRRAFLRAEDPRTIAGPWDDAPADRLERFAADVRRTSMQTVVCASEPHGQLPADLCDRLGLPASHSAFVPTLRSAEDRWPKVRGKQGPLWPYDEWVAVLVIGGLLLRWRAHMRRR